MQFYKAEVNVPVYNSVKQKAPKFSEEKAQTQKS